MQTLSEQISWYLDYLAARPASPRTIANYRSELGRLDRYAASQGCTTAEGLTDDLLRAAAADFMAEGAAAVARAAEDHRFTTRSKGNEAAASLMVIATRGMVVALRKKRGLIVADLSAVDAPRVPKRLQPRVQPDDFLKLEAAVLRRAGNPRHTGFELARDRALILFLYETGLRALEASRLNLADVDLERGAVDVQEGKGRQPRRLGIADPDPAAIDGGETIRRLRSYLLERQRRPSAHLPALWLGVRGKRASPATLRTILRELCAEAGVVNLPVHAFRRGWFTAAYRSEPRDLPILAARMGWSDHGTQMAAVYTRGALMDFAALPRPLVSRICYVRDARGS